MAGGYSTPSGDQYEYLAGLLQELGRRLAELEAPTGTSINSLVAQVQQAIADINTTVTAAIAANSYTKSQIDSKIASPGAIAPTTVSASGSVSAGGNVAVGGQLTCLDAYNTDITWTRRGGWWGNDGRAGFASSSRRKKTDIQPARLDPRAFLQVTDYSFFYRAEIARRTQMRIDGTDADYRPAREFGLMAEDLAAAGFGQFVYFDADGNAEGIEYSMLTVPLLAVARYQDERITTLEADVAALRSLINDLSKRLAAPELNGEIA